MNDDEGLKEIMECDPCDRAETEKPPVDATAVQTPVKKPRGGFRMPLFLRRKAADQAESSTSLDPENEASNQPERITSPDPENKVANQAQGGTGPGPGHEAADRRARGSNNRRRLLTAAIALVFIVSSVLLILRLIGYHRDNLTYTRVSEQVPQVDPRDYFIQAENTADRITPFPAPAATDTDAQANVPTPAPLPYEVLSGNPSDLGETGILKDYEKLKEQYGELSGWIRVPGFRKPLSYPVMHTDNDEYYMTHDFYGNDSYAGSIFFDSRNDPSMVEQHFILYGHAMKDMAMFGFFSDYPDNGEALAGVRHIYLDLMNVRLEYEIFSTYYAKPDEPYRQTWFPSDDDFLAFLNRIKDRSAYDFGTEELTRQDRILTLSTCSGGLFEDGRTVVHARLKRMITYDTAAAGDYAEPAVEGDANPVSANVYIAALEVHYLPVSEEETGENSSEGPEPTPSPSPAAREDAQESPGGTPPATGTASPAPQELVACVLDPPFRTSRGEFSTSVPEEIDTVILTIVTADPKARTELFNNGNKLQTRDVPLEIGENEIKIRVVSRDGQYARYTTLTVTRGSIPVQETGDAESTVQEPSASETPTPSEAPDSERASSPSNEQ